MGFPRDVCSPTLPRVSFCPLLPIPIKLEKADNSQRQAAGQVWKNSHSLGLLQVPKLTLERGGKEVSGEAQTLGRRPGHSPQGELSQRKARHHPRRVREENGGVQ